MNGRKEMLTAVIGIAIVSLTITAVTANSWKSNVTPLYTLRMEGASSKMNFLPTEMNTFTYITEKGYNLAYNTTGCRECFGARYVVPLWPYTCGTCDLYYCEEPTHCGTCGTCGTCNSTCPSTCDGYTCDDTSCQNTCADTCPDTCDNWTCEGSTCSGWTCNMYTCWYYWTCRPTCDLYYTCYFMCYETNGIEC